MFRLSIQGQAAVVSNRWTTAMTCTIPAASIIKMSGMMQRMPQGEQPLEA